MLHQIQYAFTTFGLIGIPVRMLFDVKNAWPTIARQRQHCVPAMIAVNYRIDMAPVVECQVYFAQPVERALLAA